MSTQEVLMFLKPDAIIRRYVGARVIQEFVNDRQFEIACFEELYPPREFIAEKHYAQHKGKFFYKWLLEYVTSSPLLVFVLRGNGVVPKVRELLGSTIPENAPCNTIRGKYGIFGGINVAHASEDVDSARREVEMWKSVTKLENRNHLRKANQYVKRYIDFQMVDSVRYREISELIVQGGIPQEEAKALFTSLLLRESDFAVETISQFAVLMVNNALLRKQ